MKSQLRSAERENWLKPVTVQRALRVRRQRPACNQRKVVAEIRVGVLNVQGMSWTKRSYRGMLWHIVMKNARAKCGCDVPVRFVYARMDERRKQSGDVGTRRVHIVCEWNGRYCLVSFVCETVANFRIGDARSRKQEVDWALGLHRCFSVSSHISLHADAERRECAWTGTRALGAWNRVVVGVATKRRPRDPGRRCEFAPGSR